MKALFRNLSVLLLGTLVLQSTGATQTAREAQTRSSSRVRHKVVHKPAGPSLAEQMQQLREQMAAQQQQIQQLQNQLSARDQQVQQAQQAAAQASSQAADASAKASEAAITGSDAKTQVAELSDTVKNVRKDDQNLTETVKSEQKRVAEADNPGAIHFKGITISPTGSFIAAETVYRTKGMGADINTQLSGEPFSGASNAHLSEFNASARQSRLALMGEGEYNNYTFRGYYEGDFLSAGSTSNDNQSNSYTFRERQIWGQVASAGGWTLTGGQQWSLVTETKSGLANLSEALPQVIDPNYTAGFSWERQFGVRLTKAFGKKIFVGASIEEPQTLNVGGGGIADTAVFQQVGNLGGLYNNQANYSYNAAPDLIFKAAFEPGFGHYEVFGIARFFRDRVYPNAVGGSNSGVGAFTDTEPAGGLGANLRIPVIKKKVDFGFHVLAGDGVGRYSDATLSDVTFRPGGTFSPIRGGSMLAGLEAHATSKLDLYAYYGGDYLERQLYFDGGKQVGYGRTTNVTTGCGIEIAPGAAAGNQILGSATATPANCSPDTRLIQEGSLGYWYDFYKGAKGRFRQGIQYSYLEKNTWQGTGGSPKAIDNMIFTSFRYYLP